LIVAGDAVFIEERSLRRNGIRRRRSSKPRGVQRNHRDWEDKSSWHQLKCSFPVQASKLNHTVSPSTSPQFGSPRQACPQITGVVRCDCG
jgi:hypothetical protein